MTTQFTQQEAIEAILNATKDGDLPLEDRLVLLCEIVKEQQREITHLRVRLEAIRNRIPDPVYVHSLTSPAPFQAPDSGGSRMDKPPCEMTP
jgi:hypothetical protein